MRSDEYSRGTQCLSSPRHDLKGLALSHEILHSEEPGKDTLPVTASITHKLPRGSSRPLSADRNAFHAGAVCRKSRALSYSPAAKWIFDACRRVWASPERSLCLRRLTSIELRALLCEEHLCFFGLVLRYIHNFLNQYMI